jgi:hypothetical protein
VDSLGGIGMAPAMPRLLAWAADAERLVSLMTIAAKTLNACYLRLRTSPLHSTSL